MRDTWDTAMVRKRSLEAANVRGHKASPTVPNGLLASQCTVRWCHRLARPALSSCDSSVWRLC